MTVKKAAYELQKVTLNLRKGDWEWLRQMHGEYGAGKTIRALVIGHRERAEGKAAQRQVSTHELDLNLEEVS